MRLCCHLVGSRALIVSNNCWTKQKKRHMNIKMAVKNSLRQFIEYPAMFMHYIEYPAMFMHYIEYPAIFMQINKCEI